MHVRADIATSIATFFGGIGAGAAMVIWPNDREIWFLILIGCSVPFVAILLLWARDGVSLIRRNATPIATDPEYIPAKAAVEMANDLLYETEWGGWIKGWTQDGDISPLVMGAKMLARRIPLYGKPPGVWGPKLIDMNDLQVEMGKWDEDLSSIRRRNRPDQVLYNELCFKSRDLYSVIEVSLKAHHA